MHVENAVDRGDGLFVEVHADARHRAGMHAVAAARDAAHVHLRDARPLRNVGHGRQELDVVGEVAEAELGQLLVAEYLHRDRHVLQVLATLLRRDDDFLEGAFPLLLRMGRDCDQACKRASPGEPPTPQRPVVCARIPCSSFDPPNLWSRHNNGDTQHSNPSFHNAASPGLWHYPERLVPHADADRGCRR